MTTQPKRKWRRGRPRAEQLSNPDLPYTMKLPDGRTLYVDFLDRVRALAIKLDRPPSPGYITALREALGLTQQEFGERVGVDKMTVSRWERGALRPSDESLEAIENLRRQTVRHSVTIPM